jgi:predicted metal-dependent hydrolase
MAKMADVEVSGVGLERSDSQGEESCDSLLPKFLNEVQKFLQTQSQKDLRIFKEFLEKMLRERQEYAEEREREHQKRMEEIR